MVEEWSITLIRYFINLYNTVEDQIKQPLICKGSRISVQTPLKDDEKKLPRANKRETKIKENSSSSSSKCEERKEERKKERKKTVKFQICNLHFATHFHKLAR